MTSAFPYGRALVALFLVLAGATVARGCWAAVSDGVLPPETLPAGIFLLCWLLMAPGAPDRDRLRR